VHPHAAGGDVAQQRHQPGHVEDVGQDLAVGLQQNGKRAIAAGHREQVGGALALLPQRRAPIPGAPRQQQRPGGALAKARGEQRRAAQLADDDVLDLVGLDQHRVGGRRVVGLGQAHHDAVVGVHRLDLNAQPGPGARGDGQRPRRVDARAERRVDHQAPIADLVAEALHHDLTVGGQRPGGLALLGEVGHDVVGGAGVEAVALGQRGAGLVGLAASLQGADLAHERPHRRAELAGAPGRVAVPERQLAGLAGGGHHPHPVALDVGDAPGGGAQHQRLAGAALVDHLLVELAHALGRAGAGPAGVAGVLGAGIQLDAVQAAVGDGAPRGHRHALGSAPPPHDVGHAVPGDPRAQLGELVGGIAPGQQVQHAVELAAGQLGERRGPAHARQQVVDAPRVDRGHGHRLLGEHIQRHPGWVG